MKDINNYILFILLFSTLSFLTLFTPIKTFSSAELEGQLNLIENLSKISQIKRFENEMIEKSRIASNSKTSLGAGICETQLIMTNDMKINSNMHVKGPVRTVNIYAEDVYANGKTDVKHTVTSDKIVSEKIESQSTLVDNISSPTVFKISFI